MAVAANLLQSRSQVKTNISPLRAPLAKPDLLGNNDARIDRGLVFDGDAYFKNLLKYSEDFSNAAWTKTRASIVAQPDGSFKLIEDSTASNDHYIVQSPTLITDKKYCYS